MQFNSGSGIFPYVNYYKGVESGQSVSKPSSHPNPRPVSVSKLEERYLKRTRSYTMFVPPKFQSAPATVNPAQTVCPVTHLDVNAVGLVRPAALKDLVLSEGTYKQLVFVVVSRTPLAPEDPNTYIALPPDHQPNRSKLFAKYHFAVTDNSEDESQNAPQPSCPTDRLPFGSNVNPLLPDPFRFVQLTPGCGAQYVTLKSSSGEALTKRPLFGRRQSRSLELAPPRSLLVRNLLQFLARAFPLDNFSKRLAALELVLIAFNGRVFNLHSMHPNASAKLNTTEVVDDYPLLRVVFLLTITCCDVVRSSPQHLDVLLGFALGDIFWYDPYVQKYTRFNKGGKLVKGASVTCLQWCADAQCFYAGFSDGLLLMFDRTRDDNENHYICAIKARSEGDRFSRVFKSRSSVSTQNPVAHYKFSGTPLTSVQTLGSGPVCVTGEDGFLRLWDPYEESFLAVVPSYYGGLFCLAWSPDGRYLAVGGADDLVAVYEVGPRQIRLVARLEGHTLWVRSVAFDIWRSPPRVHSSPVTYRLGSVGDDGKLLVWDFIPRLVPRVRRKGKREEEGAILHGVVGKSEAPFLEPVGEVECELGRLLGVSFDESGIWVVASGGDIRKWERPE